MNYHPYPRATPEQLAWEWIQQASMRLDQSLKAMLMAIKADPKARKNKRLHELVDIFRRLEKEMRVIE